ncbi:MAG: heme-binding protein, partial [Chloroflexales bacterium]|nr:heme-binding protein [Chloroflexales bacterium]
MTRLLYVDQPPAPPYGPPLTLADAKRIASAAEAAASERGWPIVVAV